MISELQDKGWFLTQEGIDACKDGMNKMSLSAIIRKALDTDLREIGSSFLSEEVYKNKADFISGPCVLQIQKIKNVCIPKYETCSSGPALYRMHVTDGITTVSCLQCGTWKLINLDTAPGTKILLKQTKIPVVNGFILLKESHFTLLGGEVPALVEKWELKKRLASHVRRGDSLEDGPPPWIPFGKSINYKDSKASSIDFKSLEPDAKEMKEDYTLFKQLRQANIAEVSKAKEGKVKVFGGGKEKLNNKYDVNMMEKPYKNNQGSIKKGQALLETSNFTYNSSKPNDSDFNAKKYEKDAFRNQHYKPDTSKLIDDRLNKYDSWNNSDNGKKRIPNNAHGCSGPDSKSSNQGYTIMKNDADKTSHRNNMNRMEENVAQRVSHVTVQQNSNHVDNQRNQTSHSAMYLHPGTEVMARYWEDKKFYHATIHAVGENSTCVVYFVEYGNYEEVRLSDIRPLSSKWNNSLPGVLQKDPINSQHLPDKDNFTGVLEFRRGGGKPFVHRSAATASDDYNYNRAKERPHKSEQRPSARLYQVPQHRQIQ